MMQSLRMRITLGTIASTAIVVSLSALCVWFAGRAVFTRTIDGKLIDRAVIWQERGIAVSSHLSHWRDVQAPDLPPSSFMAQILDDQRREIDHSPSMPPGESFLQILDRGTPPGQVIAMRLHDGRPYLCIWVKTFSRAPVALGSPGQPPPSAPAAGSQPLIALIAYDMSSFDNELTRLGWLLIGLWVAAVLLSAVISLWLCRAVLSPVRRLSQTIKDIDPSNLTARVATDDVPVEMMEVLQRLNDLFTRVEMAIQREKTTIANIAHELRNPIAGLRTTLEFALARQCDAGAKQTQERCLVMVIQMQSMVGNLLTLARLEAGQETWLPEEVDVVHLLHATWELHAGRAAERGLAISWAGAGAALITSSREQVRVIASNLLDNAVSYALGGSCITVSVMRLDGQLRLTMANPTDGTLRDASLVFRPFWRGDQARLVGTHCGLGLALVERIVRCLHGTIAAALDSHGLFTITLTLPTHAPMAVPRPLVPSGPQRPATAGQDAPAATTVVSGSVERPILSEPASSAAAR